MNSTMAAMEPTDTMGRLQSFTIDQAAGATALVLGSVGGLLLVIWKSIWLSGSMLSGRAEKVD